MTNRNERCIILVEVEIEHNYSRTISLWLSELPSDVKRQANKVKLDCNLAVIRVQRIIENRIIARSTLASAELDPPNLQGFFYIKKEVVYGGKKILLVKTKRRLF